MIVLFKPQIIPQNPKNLVDRCGSGGRGEVPSSSLESKIPLVLCAFSVSRVQAYSIPCTSPWGQPRDKRKRARRTNYVNQTHICQHRTLCILIALEHRRQVSLTKKTTRPATATADRTKRRRYVIRSWEERAAIQAHSRRTNSEPPDIQTIISSNYHLHQTTITLVTTTRLSLYLRFPLVQST